MTIFVDDVEHPFGRMLMCHCWTDGPIEELHAFAAGLGLHREWFQCPPKASWEHYDVSKSVKAAALARGAVLTDRYGPLEFEARRVLRNAANETNPALYRAIGRLLMLASVREK